ncbi:MAG: peroxiredoxin [Actinomycetota bacterium]|jgi:peroxiredoxin
MSSTRLHELEERFAALGESIEDSPVKEALSVLHAIVQEMGDGGRPTDGAVAGPLTIEDVANLYQHAPAMEGQAEADGLAVGTEAPDFALPDANGQIVRLSDFRGRPVVLVFYPLDWSPGCSRQLDLYQQELDEFQRRGVEIIGISVDSIYSHGAWAAVRGITFPLLADFHPKGDVAKRYGVWRERDGFGERALFVVDGDGVIRYAHVSPFVHHLPDIYDLYAALDRLAPAAAA